MSDFDSDDFFDDEEDLEFELEPEVEVEFRWVEEDLEHFMLMRIGESSLGDEAHIIKLTEELCYDLYCFLKDKYQLVN